MINIFETTWNWHQSHELYEDKLKPLLHLELAPLEAWDIWAVMFFLTWLRYNGCHGEISHDDDDDDDDERSITYI